MAIDKFELDVDDLLESFEDLDSAKPGHLDAEADRRWYSTRVDIGVEATERGVDGMVGGVLGNLGKRKRPPSIEPTP